MDGGFFCSKRDDFKFLSINQLLFGTDAYTDSYSDRQSGDDRMPTVKRMMQLLMPSRQHVLADPAHPLGRTRTREYLLRREVVKQFWMVAGAAMLLLPVLHWVVAVGLFTTFVSFMYLDEAPTLAEEWYDGH